MKTIQPLPLLIAMLIASHIYAQPVTLDPTFGQDKWRLDPIQANVSKEYYEIKKNRSDCEPISTFPWAEGFENNGTEIPPCWESAATSPSSWRWTIVPDSTGTPPTAYEGNFKARIYRSGLGGDLMTWSARLISPIFDLSDLNDPVLSFRHARNGTAAAWIGLLYKNHLDGFWDPLYYFPIPDTIFDWRHQDITLHQYSSNCFQIAFQSIFPSTFGINVIADLQLDDIKIMDRSQYTDATLSNFSIAEGELNPEFSSNIRNYTINVVDVEEITITAIPTNPYATITGVGTFLLEAGENSFTVNVIAADGVTNLDYNIVVNNLVGITDVMQESSFVRVYPNPTTGKLTIDNGQLTINNVEVFDVYGRKHECTNARKHEGEVLIDILHLSAGIYFIKISTEAGIITKKIIKN